MCGIKKKRKKEKSKQIKIPLGSCRFFVGRGWSEEIASLLDWICNLIHRLLFLSIKCELLVTWNIFFITCFAIWINMFTVVIILTTFRLLYFLAFITHLVFVLGNLLGILNRKPLFNPRRKIVLIPFLCLENISYQLIFTSHSFCVVCSLN